MSEVGIKLQVMQHVIRGHAGQQIMVIFGARKES
jgi:hypothetical protein